MPAVRGNPADKWSRRASVAGQDYQAGVQSPRRPWAQSAQQAAGTWKQGVQEAAAKGRFEKGVAKAGDAAWQAGVSSKGVNRYSEGVQVAQSKYEAAVAPYLAVINGVALPPRGPKGSPQNLQRVAAITNALHQKKLSS